MTNKEQFWVNAETSAMLEELGCESQFDFHMCKQDEYPHEALLSDRGACNYVAKRDDGTTYLDEDEGVHIFHFSDLLLFQNAKKVWPDSWEESSRMLYRLILLSAKNNFYWTDWLHEEVKKALTEKR